ncbi:protein kinase domain-containing protein (plasmid) [Legionella sp. D16C41]|uniref:protein kinase domain-containing protein n=1 Tax=Legionella sp. D16C41 TaxID=3402688 RepID=UPI003AF5A847
MAIEINLENLSEEAQRALCTYISDNSPEFLMTKTVYKLASDTPDNFYLKNNLIIDEENSSPEIRRYFIISKKEDDLLGEGTFSKVRAISGAIEVDLTKRTILYTECKDKAVKIKNPKWAQEKHNSENTKYRHSEAVKDYETHKDFSHFGMQKPIKVKRTCGAKFFKKSYSVVNKFPGQDLDNELVDFINYVRPNLNQIITSVIIPLLEAYKSQISDKGYVHRDIKVGNIRAYITTVNSTINFLDLDKSQKLGTEDSVFGTPGYVPLEVFNDSPPALSITRDMFALGVVLMACINPNLEPDQLFYDLGAKDTQEAFNLSLSLQASESYHPIQLLAMLSKTKEDFFTYVLDVQEEEAEKVINIINNMLSSDPKNRPADTDAVIQKFKEIKDDLEQHRSLTTFSKA